VGYGGCAGCAFISETAQVELKSGRVQGPASNAACCALYIPAKLEPITVIGSAMTITPKNITIIPNDLPTVTGLHSSTSQLNVSTLCGLGGPWRGCSGDV